MKLKSGCVGCFAGLSCNSRIEIINLLKEKGKLSVLQIAKHFEITQPTISHHLQYLEEAEILISEKVGRKVFYSIHPKCQKKNCQIFL